MSKHIPLSFEFFPPKTADGIEKLRETRRQLAKFDPEFFSVTFGAGGSTRDRTMDTVLEIQQEGYAAAPHISCISVSYTHLDVYKRQAYAGRYVAKNIVAAGLADKCLVQVSYAIGVAQPTSIMVETYGTGKVSDEVLTRLVREHFDLRPKGIVKMLDLLRPIYTKTAAYGHFGRDEPEFTWEATDRAAMLKAAAGL